MNAKPQLSSPIQSKAVLSQGFDLYTPMQMQNTPHTATNFGMKCAFFHVCTVKTLP